MKAILSSKRLWVIALTVVFHMLASHHIVLADANIDGIADSAILAAGAVGVVITKLMDAKKAAQPAR